MDRVLLVGVAFGVVVLPVLACVRFAQGYPRNGFVDLFLLALALVELFWLLHRERVERRRNAGT